MKVLVTGAAGRLGSRLIPLMLDEGWQVIATDHADRNNLPVPTQVADLTDLAAVNRLCEGGVDVLVHLANTSSWEITTPEIALNYNLSMAMNSFQAAVAAGAKRIVFASTMHVGTWVRSDRTLARDLPVPHLPIDGTLPAEPYSYYGLAKAMGEQMLGFYTRARGLTTFAIRFPWMPPRLEEMRGKGEYTTLRPVSLALVNSYLTYEDGASLVVACIKSDVTGMHTYLPAARGTLSCRDHRQMIREFFPNVPLRKPIEEIESLVDNSLIEKEVGWSPSC